MAKTKAEFVPVVPDEDFITRAWLVSGAYEVKSPLYMNRNMRIAAASWCSAPDFWRPL